MDPETTKKQVQDILAVSGNGDAKLVPILLSVQNRFGYLPKKSRTANSGFSENELRTDLFRSLILFTL